MCAISSVDRRLGRCRAARASAPSALRRGDHHLGGAGRAVLVGVLAGLVDVEAVMRVLHGRDADAARDQLGDQLRPAASSCRCRSTRRGRRSSWTRLRRAWRATGSAARASRPSAARRASARWRGLAMCLRPIGEVVVAGDQRQRGGDPQPDLADQHAVTADARPASPTIRKPSAIICSAVFHFASLLTGTPTCSSARNSRRPETRISRHRMTSAGRTTQPAMRSDRDQDQHDGGDQQLVGDRVEEAAERRDLLLQRRAT